MAQVQLSQGQSVLVDDEDAAWCNQWVWSLGPKGYAVRMATLSDGERRMVYLHRALMKAKAGVKIDHINMDKRDCRRSNLREATTAENNRNVGVRHHNTSGHTGVNWQAARQRWRAYIVVGGKQHFGGYFTTEAEAVAARDELARRYHGNFARTSVT